MNFFRTYKPMIPLLLFTVMLVPVRMIMTHSLSGMFICWNLFLGILPVYFSYKALRVSSALVSRMLMLLWLLFFPNAAYLVTDMIHLERKSDLSGWLNLVLLVSAAINGLLFSMGSLSNIERRLKKSWPSKYVDLLILFLLLLCGYGIYLGRCLRWNSWDVIVDPVALFTDIVNHIARPVYHRQVWFMALLFAAWLYILYLLFLRYAHRRT